MWSGSRPARSTGMGRADNSDDTHRHSGKERRQDRGLDGACYRRAVSSREIEESWMSNKSAQNDTIKDRLSRTSEIAITVTGRKSGRAISRPIWFVWDDGMLYLLPVKGSDTQW